VVTLRNVNALRSAPAGAPALYLSQAASAAGEPMMSKLLRLSVIVALLSVLGACVLVPVGPRHGYYGPPAVVAPVYVRVR
jgi:hypothetical protein